jgi:hypothetical protein
MDSTPRALDRWLPFVGIALLIEASLGFLPAIRKGGSGDIGLLFQSACAAAAGGATLLAARRRNAPEILRAFLWVAFLALGTLKVSVYLVYGISAALVNAWVILSNASWSLIGIGAPILWGAAVALRDDPGSATAQKVGRIAAGVVQLGFVLLFASELNSWGMFWRYASFGSTPGFGSYGVWQALQLADRILLLWASIESMRTPVDDETVRRRAARIHRLMGWWLLLSMLSAAVGQIIMSTAQSTTFEKVQPVLLRILIYKTVAVAAMLALYLHFASRRSEPVVA